MTSFSMEILGNNHVVADAEVMMQLLREAGFTATAVPTEVDILIVVGCSTPRLAARVEELRKAFEYKVIIPAGCVEKEKFKKFPVVCSEQSHKIVEVVEEALHNNYTQLLGKKELPPLIFPKQRINPSVLVLPIARGCGYNMKSYPLPEIVKIVQQAAGKVAQIWLTAPDVFGYGMDIDNSLPTLLEAIVKVEGDFKIKLGRGTMKNLGKIKQSLLPWLEHEKVFQYLYFPLFTGSSRMMKELKLGSAESASAIGEIRKKIPALTWKTEIIVGYPQESEEDFWQTLNKLRETNPDKVLLVPFQAKQSTPKGKSPKIVPELAERRVKTLVDISSNIARLRNEQWLGWKGTIVMEYNNNGQGVGRTFTYKPVCVAGEGIAGQQVTVHIHKAETEELLGRVTV